MSRALATTLAIVTLTASLFALSKVWVQTPPPAGTTVTSEA